MLDLNKAIDFMEKVAIQAGEMLLLLQPNSRRLDSRKDFLSDADLKSEEMILRMLNSEYPDIPVLSEETGGDEIKDGYLWVIDPVDGTINYFLQDDHFGVSIALLKDGYTIAGAVYLPAKKKVFYATIECNSKMYDVLKKDRVDIKVNGEESLSNSQIWFDWGKEKNNGKDHKEVSEILLKIDSKTLYPQIRNSVTSDMINVALGKISGYVFPKSDSFDIAAVGFIVERAGGKVTDMGGNRWNPFSSGIIASNSLIHQELINTLK